LNLQTVLWFSDIPCPYHVFADRGGDAHANCTVQWIQFQGHELDFTANFIIQVSKLQRDAGDWGSYEDVADVGNSPWECNDLDNEYDYKYRVIAYDRSNNNRRTRPSESCGIHHFLFLDVNCEF
jgi:hypothetical protein